MALIVKYIREKVDMAWACFKEKRNKFNKVINFFLWIFNFNLTFKKC